MELFAFRTRSWWVTVGVHKTSAYSSGGYGDYQRVYQFWKFIVNCHRKRK